MLNFTLSALSFLFFFFTGVKFTLATVGLIFILSFITTKMYTAKPAYFLFYVFFIFLYLLILFKFYNFTIIFLIFFVLYSTVFIVFFLFFIAHEDLKKTKEVYKNSTFYLLIFFFLPLCLKPI